MFVRFVDLERQSTPAEALLTLEDITADLGLRFELVPVGGTWADAVTCRRAVLRRPSGQILGIGTGKGVAEQALASGGYEAYEHAAIQSALPDSPSQIQHAVLPAAPFENIDKLYAYARRTRPDRPQPVLSFTQISSLHPDPTPADPAHPATASQRHARLDGVANQCVLYPRTVVDPALRMTSDLADLSPLDRYASSSGYAAGTSLSDALLHAVNELIERDAVSAYMLTSATQPPVLTAICLDPPAPLRDLVEEITDHNQAPVLLVQLPAVAGTVVMAYQGPVKTALPSVGTGCSADPRIAVERAITELHQDVVANDLGATWADEGGVDLTNLNRLPQLRHAAQIRPPHIARTRGYHQFLEDNSTGPGTDLVPQLTAQGFTTLWRTVWRRATARGEIHIVQVVIPGLERFDNIVLGRPILPAGRLTSVRAARSLLTEAS